MMDGIFDAVDEALGLSEEQKRKAEGFFGGLARRPQPQPGIGSTPPFNPAAPGPFERSVWPLGRRNTQVLGLAEPSPDVRPATGTPTPGTAPLGQSQDLLGRYREWERQEPLPTDFKRPKLGFGGKVLGGLETAGAYLLNPKLGQQVYEARFHPERQQLAEARERWAERGKAFAEEPKLVEQAGRAREAEALAVKAETAAQQPPRTEKPESLDREAYDYYLSQGMTPAAARKQVLADAAEQKPGPKENKPVAGRVNGQPRWGVQTDKGWIDPQTQQPLPGFEPPPNFADTGFYEPVEVPTAGGGMQPGRFNRRTGRTEVIPPGQAVPIGRAAQKEIDQALQTARGMDRMDAQQKEILKSAETRGQRGSAGGGPYLNGPESMQFLANHIAMTMGTVKGARLGRDLIEAHIKARDLGQDLEAVAQRVLAGGVITHEQAQQMLATTAVNRRQVWRQAQAAAEQYGVPNAVRLPSDLAGPQDQNGETQTYQGHTYRRSGPGQPWRRAD